MIVTGSLIDRDNDETKAVLTGHQVIEKTPSIQVCFCCEAYFEGAFCSSCGEKNIEKKCGFCG